MIACPICQGLHNLVLDSRDHLLGVRRRRRCNGCGHRFSTLEHHFDFDHQSVSDITNEAKLIRKLKVLIDEWAENHPKSGKENPSPPTSGESP